jgi:methyl-accepting chemotaxis protein
MTIKARLWLMASVAVIGLVSVFGTGKTGIDSCQVNFDKVVDDRLPKLIEVEKLIIRIVQNQRDVREYLLLTDPARRDEVEKRIAEARVQIKESFDYLTTSIKSEKGKQLLAAAQNSRVPVSQSSDKAIAMVKAGQVDEAAKYITSIEVRDFGRAYRNDLEALIDFQKELAKVSSIEGKENSANANMWMLIISAVAVGILIGIALMVIRNVSGAITQIVGSVTQVASTMKFNTRLPARNDELNAVSQSLNSMLASLETAVADSNKVIGAIAQGDFSQRINNAYVGDLERLKQGINSSAENITCVMNNLQEAMQALKAGQLSAHVDADAPGSYGVMLDYVKTSFKELNAVVSDINHIVDQMKNGNFDARVNANAHGDLLIMKDNFNRSMEMTAQVVRSIVEVVEAQASGDLTKQLPSGAYHGLFQDLKNAMNYSAEAVKDKVIVAVNASMVVNDAAAQVSQGSSDLSSRVQEQAAALEQTSATMHEMTAAVQANTENAAKVAELAHQVQGQSKDGVAVMQQTIHAMKSIQEASSKIADIVSIIDSIAFQTNLLALNAAVEAARAGEHGRGFAVVASEVRALAGKSADAAKDIKGLIDDSVNRIDVGTKLADKSGEMLEQINQSVAQVATMIESISSASREQTTGISQVHLAIADIDRVTQENAALVEETTAAAESLSSEANGLRDSMAFFKTGAPQFSNAQTHTRKPAKKAALPAPKASSTASASSSEWSEF